MFNNIKDRRLLQSSKNSTTLLQKSNLIKNQNHIKNRKYSNEKYKTQIINQIYYKHFSLQNNIIQNISNINSINNNNNYKNFISKRNIKKNSLRNYQNNKSINEKNNIPIPVKKNSKDQLKIKTKLYGNYASNELNKNYLKQTNNTTEANISLIENNNITEEKIEKKKEKIKVNNNNDDNIILINISNKSNSKKKDKNNNRKLSSNSNFKKLNDNSINDFDTNINYKNKKIKNNGCKKNNKNYQTTEKKINIEYFKKQKYQKGGNDIKYSETKNKKIRKDNSLFNTLKENQGNYYYLVVSDDKFDNINNEEKKKLRNLENSLAINNNRTYYLEKTSKYLDKKNLSPKSNIIEKNSLKIKESNKKILIANNNATIICDKEKNLSNNINTITNEQFISEKKNKYENIIINKNLLNNDKNKTINKKSKIINNYNNSFLKYNEIESNGPYLENILKHYENKDKDKKAKIKKESKAKKEIIKNILDKENINNNLNDSNLNIKKNMKKSNIKVKNSNSNIDINFNNINSEKSKRKINRPNNVKNLNYNTKVKKIENKLAKTKSNNNYKNKNEKNDINKNFFENFNDNNISICTSDENRKTNKDEEIGNNPHINKLSTYYNDAKKTLKNSNLFYKQKSSKTFLDIKSQNTSKVINNNYNIIEDDELLSNKTIKVPIFVDVILINNLLGSNINAKDKNFEIKNLYDIISKLNNYKPKKYFLNFLDDKSLMILSSINRQFFINLRIMFYHNIYRKIFTDKKFITKIILSTCSYASKEIKNCEKTKLKELYESFGNKTSKYDNLIKQDINRTFPLDSNFNKNREKLYKFLTSYSNYKTSIGYAQGLNFIVANALTFFDKEEEAFLFIDGLINVFKLEMYMGENNPNFTLQIKKFSNIISKYIGDIVKYLEKKLLSHDFFSIRWILTLFSNSMNSKNLMITWCFMIIFGWKFFYCFVIQIILFYKNDIYKTSENNLSKKMKKLLNEERFNDDIKEIINNTLNFMSKNIIM